MADEPISPQQMQSVIQELQSTRSQVQAIASQINEISLTLNALSSQDKDRPVFRAVGNLLLEVDDRDALLAELGESHASFESHLEKLMERESDLVSQYEEMIESFENQ
tara:strand:+ start:742 stop:1065 length:324 start_codon:yes stop_codon:yes gene_type:complete